MWGIIFSLGLLLLFLGRSHSLVMTSSFHKPELDVLGLGPEDFRQILARSFFALRATLEMIPTTNLAQEAPDTVEAYWRLLMLAQRITPAGWTELRSWLEWGTEPLSPLRRHGH
jgi:hypothetical protein